MQNRTLQALRVGLYQLFFMDRIPASAAINETVDALKKARQPKWLTGFVNGLLRTVARRQQNIPLPWQDESLVPAVVRLSHPDWLLERWVTRYGEKQTARICRANNTEPPLVLRLNKKMTDRERLLARLHEGKINASPGRYMETAVYIRDYRGSIADLPGFNEGLFQVQDEAAQLISLLLGPLRPAHRYLDGCAGLGGKTSHLAEMLPLITDPPTLTAVEPNEQRRQLLKDNLARLRLTPLVEIIAAPLENIPPMDLFAGILIDAPCSGLGVIRRHPDIRWNRSPKDLLRYQDNQLALLNNAVAFLDTSGVLVYATCSMEPEENEEVIQIFLANHADFTLASSKPYLPPAAENLVTATGFFSTVPEEEGLGGFFAARLIRKM
jgi:16S rRNA (cytosine967-C5)-methyltransferase